MERECILILVRALVAEIEANLHPDSYGEVKYHLPAFYLAKNVLGSLPQDVEKFISVLERA